MIQDILPHHFDNSYKDISPNEESRIICFMDEKVLAFHDEERQGLRFPLYREVKGKDTVYIFSIDEKDYFLCLDEISLEGYDLYSLRDVRSFGLKDNRDIFAVYSAYHLYKWYGNNVFCGHCAGRMERAHDERALVCPKCGLCVYPRINPAVIIGVKNGDRILLTKYRSGFAHNALVAGFTEFGETLEETVVREVKEETGLSVRNIRYYKSQPWGIAQDVLAGFYCDVDGDDKIVMDEHELRYADWVKREDIVLQPNDYSLTNEMMRRFKEGLEK